jgi:NAD-dependent dihydropyrimidine dehydrogenase PreA subunit/nitroreductase
MAVTHSLYRESGLVVVDQETCTGCRECVDTCPTETLTLHAGKVVPNDTSPLGCIACGHCMMVCPEACITVTGRGMLPADLVPLPSPDAKATADTLAGLMSGRRSIRRFDGREVPADLLARITEMATSAPMGIPPWDVGCVVVAGRAKVQRLAEAIIQDYRQFLKIFRPLVLALMRPFVRRATHEQFTHFIRPLAEMLVACRERGKDALFWDAPAVLIFHHSAYAGAEDATIACTFAMLAAESLGLGSTMIGSAPPILQRNKALREAYGIPPGSMPALVLIVGYPAVAFRRSIRRHFTSVRVA